MRIEYFIGAVLFIFCVFAVVFLVMQSMEREKLLTEKQIELCRELYQEKAQNEALRERIRKLELLKNINE